MKEYEKECMTEYKTEHKTENKMECKTEHMTESKTAYKKKNKKENMAEYEKGHKKENMVEHTSGYIGNIQEEQLETHRKDQVDREMQPYLDKAQVLIEALPYIQRFNRKIIVVKYGGSAMVDDALKQRVMEDVTLLKLVGFKPVIVHGGGKEISRWLEKVHIQPRFVNGLRVTDTDTMEVAEMVLGRVNKELVQLVQSLGVRAIGISGKDGGLLRVSKKQPDGEDIGFVGEIEQVNGQILLDLLEKDFLPIVCPVGMDENYETYNINADDAACAVARALGAEKLAFLTDIEGVYADPKDPSSLISELGISEAKRLMEQGFIGGGMLPKLQNCIDAIEAGVSRVHILDGRIPHCLLLEIFTKRGIGTAIVGEHTTEA